VTPKETLSWALADGLAIPDTLGRRVFRCSATLFDGTQLPCVVLREATAHLDLGLRYLRASVVAGREVDPSAVEQLAGLMRAYALGSSRVALEQVVSLRTCPFAIPWEILRDLPGELGWSPVTFTATMDDGARFGFHTAFSMAFFDMPTGYGGDRVRAVTLGADDGQHLHRERDGFAAFVEDVDFGAA
jgi:hypothetical protein